MERIYLKQEEIDKLINHRRWVDHIERYLLIRRFVYGNVVDLGCGTGYGTKLLSENPDVSKVTAFDINKESLEFGRNEYQYNNKVELTNSLDHLKHLEKDGVDVMIALELIEHIKDPSEFYKYVEMLDPNIAIISFPNKPSVKYNPFHHHDYRRQDVCDIMNGYIAVKHLDINDVTIMIFIKAPRKMPKEIYHNILDLWH
jgi:2-polyprenyl-3-methyl-5-hydroxy-6-metoxy-1,4-benzoquinol methylase